ncbi:MAG: hypothetical protein ACFE8G_08200 [Candidatus Hermodarchaeota archaeon]
MNFFDGLFLFISILMNILVIAIFIVRKKGFEQLEHKIGYIVISCAIPLFIIMIYYILIGKELWIIIYIIIIISFLMIEMILDYILKIEFRSNLKIAIPYIIIYYIAFWGLLAISFLINLIMGFIVFGLFTLNLISTIYAHKSDKKNRL